MKRVFFYSIIFSGVLFSCAPRVITNIVKTYPPLKETEEFVVYERAKDDKIPKYSETIGKISVVDNGFSKSISYPEAVGIASDETKKYGGNALLVTDHIEPSFWGSTMHQIGGVMLRVDKNKTDEAVSSKDTYTSLEENYKRNNIAIPTHIISLNMGYSNIYNRTEGLKGYEKHFEDIMSQGFNWDARYSYHHHGSKYGIGFIFSQYYSNFFKDVYAYNLYHSTQLNYAGIMMSVKNHFSPKWIYNTELGLGYLSMKRIISDKHQKGYITASNLGVNVGMGISYKINKHFGIGADLSIIGGIFSSVNYENLIPPSNTPEINDENRLGAFRINVQTGIRYYF